MKEFLQKLIAPVIAAVLAAGLANSAFNDWSKTASSNATADASINWAEGMAPSSINDSARAMMARLAEWRDDTNGTILTGGTSTAYTITTSQTITPVTGDRITFRAHVENGTNPTVAVNGGATKSIWCSSGTTATNIPVNFFTNKGVYTIRYDGTEWVVEGCHGTPSTNAGLKSETITSNSTSNTKASGQYVFTGISTRLGCSFVPKYTGRIMLFVQGETWNTSGSGGVYEAGIYYMPGAVNAGDQVQFPVQQPTSNGHTIITTNANDRMAFSDQGMVTGLTLGTTYYFDLGFSTNGVGTAVMANLQCIFYEF